MRSMIISALVFSLASAGAVQRREVATLSSQLAVGSGCGGVDTRICSAGAQCFAANPGEPKICGSFKAACTDNVQCASPYTCSAGLCQGISQPLPPVITTPDNSLGLGELCSENKQCRFGAECFASNVLRAKQCGGFNAACKNSTQCAGGVTCNSGLCNGAPASTTTTTSVTPTTSTKTGTTTTPSTTTSTHNSSTTATPSTTTSTRISSVTTTTSHPTTSAQPPRPNPTTTTTRPSSPVTPSHTGSIPVPPIGTGSPQPHPQPQPPKNGTAPPTSGRPIPPPFTGGATDKTGVALSIVGAAVLMAMALAF